MELAIRTGMEISLDGPASDDVGEGCADTQILGKLRRQRHIAPLCLLAVQWQDLKLARQWRPVIVSRNARGFPSIGSANKAKRDCAGLVHIVVRGNLKHRSPVRKIADVRRSGVVVIHVFAKFLVGVWSALDGGALGLPDRLCRRDGAMGSDSQTRVNG